MGNPQPDDRNPSRADRAKLARQAAAIKSAKTLGSKLREQLARMGATQKEFADAIGTRQPMVSQWVTGGEKKAPDRVAIVRMAEYLKVPIAYLVDDRIEDLDDVPMGEQAVGARTPADPEWVLSEDDRTVLRVVRALGHGRAMKRLLDSKVDDPAETPPGRVPLNVSTRPARPADPDADRSGARERPNGLRK